MEGSLFCLHALSIKGLLNYKKLFQVNVMSKLHQILTTLSTFKSLEYITYIMAKLPTLILKQHQDVIINHHLLDFLLKNLGDLNVPEKIKINVLEFYEKLTREQVLPSSLWNYILRDDVTKNNATKITKTQKLLNLFDTLQHSDKPLIVQYLAAKCVLNIFKNLITSFGKSHSLHICQFERLICNADIQTQHQELNIDSLILKRTLPTFVRIINVTSHNKLKINDNNHNSNYELLIESINTLAELVDLHPDLQMTACYTNQLLITVNELLNSKICADMGIPHETTKGKILRCGLLKLCSVLCSHHENVRKKLVDSPYDLMEYVTKAIMFNENCDTDSEMLRYSSILCLLSFSRSIQLLRTNFLDTNIWKSLVDIAKSLYKEIDSKQNLTLNQLNDMKLQNLRESPILIKLNILNACVSLICNLLLDFSPAKEYLMTQSDIVDILCIIIKDPKYDGPFKQIIKLNAIWALMNASFKAEKFVKLDILTRLDFNSHLLPALRKLTDPGMICPTNTARNEHSSYQENDDYEENHESIFGIKVLGLMRNVCSGGKSHLTVVLPNIGEALINELSSIISCPFALPYIKELAICVLINLSQAGEILNEENNSSNTTDTSSYPMETVLPDENRVGSTKNLEKLENNYARNFSIFDDEKPIKDTDTREEKVWLGGATYSILHPNYLTDPNAFANSNLIMKERANYLSPTIIIKKFLASKLKYNLALRDDILIALIDCVFASPAYDVYNQTDFENNISAIDNSQKMAEAKDANAKPYTSPLNLEDKAPGPPCDDPMSLDIPFSMKGSPNPNLNDTITIEDLGEDESSADSEVNNNNTGNAHTAEADLPPAALKGGVSYTVSILTEIQNNQNKEGRGNDNQSLNPNTSTTSNQKPQDLTFQSSVDKSNELTSTPLNHLQRSAIRCLNALYAPKNIAKIESVCEYVPFPLNMLTREYYYNSSGTFQQIADESSTSYNNNRVSIKSFYWRVLYNVLKGRPIFHTNDFIMDKNLSDQNNLTTSKIKFIALKNFIKLLKRQTNIIIPPPPNQPTSSSNLSHDIDNDAIKSNQIQCPKQSERTSKIFEVSTDISLRNDILIDTNRENVKNIIPAFVSWLKDESKVNKKRAGTRKVKAQDDTINTVNIIYNKEEEEEK
ncbi:unnamed protein product [Gordionus sp. m RMFG-2023]